MWYKGYGGIHVQVYVGCRVFELVKSYLCVSVPVLDDDCGAIVRFVYDDSLFGVCRGWARFLLSWSSSGSVGRTVPY